MRVALVVLLSMLMGCAGRGGPDPAPSKYEPFVGTYRGGFASALTEDPADDLNYSSCNPGVADCVVHHDPLVNILLQLSVADSGELSVAFFRSPSDLAAGSQLDLLGRGCITRLGSAESFNTRPQPAGPLWTASFPLTVENQLCLGKLRPTSTHSIELAYHDDPEDGAQSRRRQITPAEIAEILNARGVRTDFGRKWNRATVHRILTNEKYIGNNVYHRTSFKLKRRHVRNGDELKGS